MGPKQPVVVEDDPDYYRVVKSDVIRKKLKINGPYGQWLSVAKLTLDLHMDEAKRIRRALKRAINNFEQDCLDSPDDGDDFEPYIQRGVKRQKRDEPMNKE